MIRRVWVWAVACILTASVSAGSLDGLGDLLNKAGKVAGQVDSAAKATNAVRKGFQDLTEKEEYYIGRTVAANILGRYKAYQDEALTAYLNRVGGLAAAVSDRPDTFAGYHVWVLDSGEVNALAAPGGFIFVTRGLLKSAPNEDAVAAVLAHEVGHICLKHGLKAIKQSRLTNAFAVLAEEGAKQAGSKELTQLSEAFNGAIGDILENMMEKGYSRSQEYDADATAIEFLSRAGYCPSGLKTLLEGMAAHDSGKSRGMGFDKTHPPPKARLEAAAKVIAAAKGPQEPDAKRANRWQPLLAKIPAD